MLRDVYLIAFSRVARSILAPLTTAGQRGKVDNPVLWFPLKTTRG